MSFDIGKYESTSGNLADINFQTEYRSLKENPVEDFFEPCLRNSYEYKRSVGYFRSSVYAVLGEAIIDFAKRNGQIKLICSPELSEKDINSIVSGYSERTELLTGRLIDQIDELLTSEDTALGTRMLATLISTEVLDIKIALQADSNGIYHEKLGVFTDTTGNVVSFKGSTNETLSGWHARGNFETIEVFCNWRGGLETERVNKHSTHFDNLWSETDPDIQVYSFPDEAIDHLKKVAYENLDVLESELIVELRRRRTPMEHQRQAIDSWLARGGRGIFQHATGSGKTFTAILAIRQHIKQGKPVLIVVPSKLLLQQWESELKSEIPEAILLLAGDNNHSWKNPDRLESMTDSTSTTNNRVVLSTMQTASTERFLNRVKVGKNLLLIADEVHQIGSPQLSRIMSLNTGWRLGLSATPNRFGDIEGTNKIFGYFEGVVQPTITLADAIASNRLVRYEYYPHVLNLTPTEAEEWQELSLQIGRQIAKDNNKSAGQLFISSYVERLLIARSRIAKKAAAKIQLACDVLTKNFENNQSWLVYCEDIDQLDQVRASLQNLGLNTIEYHSNMRGEKEDAMKWFCEFGGICVSIRCLDEGVDIPQVSHALILASSQNPRQFIQRRGRVLRRSPGKHIAFVHDAVVTPVNIHDEPHQISLLKSEISRAIEFSDASINRNAGAKLRKIAIDMGIDPADCWDCGIEADQEEINGTF